MTPLPAPAVDLDVRPARLTMLGQYGLTGMVTTMTLALLVTVVAGGARFGGTRAFLAGCLVVMAVLTVMIAVVVAGTATGWARLDGTVLTGRVVRRRRVDLATATVVVNPVRLRARDASGGRLQVRLTVAGRGLLPAPQLHALADAIGDPAAAAWLHGLAGDARCRERLARAQRSARVGGVAVLVLAAVATALEIAVLVLTLGS